MATNEVTNSGQLKCVQADSHRKHLRSQVLDAPLSGGNLFLWVAIFIDRGLHHRAPKGFHKPGKDRSAARGNYAIDIVRPSPSSQRIPRHLKRPGACTIPIIKVSETHMQGKFLKDIVYD